MERTVASDRDEREVNVSFLNAAQFDFRSFGSFFYSLHSHLVRGQVDAFVLLEFGYYPFDNFVIEIVAAESGVAVGREYLEYAVVEFQYGYVERTAAKVVNKNLLFFGVFVQTVT